MLHGGKNTLACSREMKKSPYLECGEDDRDGDGDKEQGRC
jgi:hypothetical protein